MLDISVINCNILLVIQFSLEQNDKMVKSLVKEKLDSRVLNKIKKILEEKGIKPVQLARKLGYSNTWSSLLMSGDRGLTVNQLIRIAEILNIEPASLLPKAQKNPATLEEFVIKTIEGPVRKIVQEEIEKALKRK